jgi:hypothetical protein
MSQRDFEPPSGTPRATPATPSSAGGTSLRGGPIGSGRPGTGGLPRADLREAARRAATPGREGGGGATPGGSSHFASSPQSLSRHGRLAGARSSRGGAGGGGGGRGHGVTSSFGATPLDLDTAADEATEGDALSPAAPGAAAAAALSSEALVWGTPFNIKAMMEAFRAFVTGFKKHHELNAVRRAPWRARRTPAARPRPRPSPCPPPPPSPLGPRA